MKLLLPKINPTVPGGIGPHFLVGITCAPISGVNIYQEAGLRSNPALPGRSLHNCWIVGWLGFGELLVVLLLGPPLFDGARVSPDVHFPELGSRKHPVVTDTYWSCVVLKGSTGISRGAHWWAPCSTLGADVRGERN